MWVSRGVWSLVGRRELVDVCDVCDVCDVWVGVAMVPPMYGRK